MATTYFFQSMCEEHPDRAPQSSLATSDDFELRSVLRGNASAGSEQKQEVQLSAEQISQLTQTLSAAQLSQSVYAMVMDAAQVGDYSQLAPQDGAALVGGLANLLSDASTVVVGEPAPHDLPRLRA